MAARSVARVDSNQRQIVEGLRKYGASVVCIHTIGNGCPDLIVGHKSRNFLFELKNPGGKLTDDEMKFHWHWKGMIWTIYSLEDAIEIIREDLE